MITQRITLGICLTLCLSCDPRNTTQQQQQDNSESPHDVTTRCMQSLEELNYVSKSTVWWCVLHRILYYTLYYYYYIHLYLAFMHLQTHRYRLFRRNRGGWSSCFISGAARRALTYACARDGRITRAPMRIC